MQIWEGQTGGEDGCLSAGGLWSLSCSKVLEEHARSSSPAFYPPPDSLRSVQRRYCWSLLTTAEAGLSVPVCVCMRAGSDHHSKLYTIHQHLWESWFMITILIIISVLFFFPSKSHAQDFSLSFQTICEWHGDGGINQIKTPTENNNKKLKKTDLNRFFLLKCEATDSFWHQSWILLYALFS